MNIKAWIHASRLRTLPLAASGIILGSLIAYYEGTFCIGIFALALITTLLLQILSNWANDYGDFSHGVDNDDRVGPQRTLQSGAITPKTMKLAIKALGIFTFISGIALLYIALGNLINLKFLLFLFVGLAAIAAALKYTIGSSNYGYKGLGDIMVFLFFGIAAVWGTYFLHAKAINLIILLPASAVGLLSAGVLNINNMRDVVNDAKQGKKTLAVRLKSKSKYYHIALIVTALVLLIVYLIWENKIWQAASLIIPSVPLLIHVTKVYSNEVPADLDPELKRLSLSTLLISIWTGIALIL